MRRLWQTPTPQKSRKEEYLERYQEAKRAGKSFFPFTVFKDAVMALVVFGVIVGLTLMLGVPTESIADPSNTSYIPRPEWYFMWLFQALKFFPGWLEPVAIVGIPAVGIIALLLVPFIDRSRERHPQRRLQATAVGIVVVSGWLALTYLGLTSAPVAPPAEQSPQAILGKRVYRELNCSYCHSIGGRGGAVGPDLSNTAAQLDKNALLSYLQNPHAMIPQSLHPKLQFTPEELQALSTYLLTLGAPVPYSAEAPKLFKRDCSSCHTTDGSGGRPGPDLSRVGSYRSPQWIATFTKNPRSAVAGATMPAFRDALGADQIDDIAAYLSNFRGQNPTPTPAVATASPTLIPAPTASPTPTPVVPSPTPGAGISPAPTPAATASPTPKAEVVSFSRDVQPIFKNRCVVCHGTAAMGGLDMTSRQAIMTTGKHSPVVIPGNAEQSILYQSLQGKATGISPMPPGTPLTAEEMKTIASWIDQGAPEN